MFDRPDSRLFNQRNVCETHEFFERHGTKALVMARFVPIVRTFVPVLAGVGKMKHRTFITANAIGAVAWAGGVTVLGYFLGQVDVIKNNIELAGDRRGRDLAAAGGPSSTSDTAEPEQRA